MFFFLPSFPPSPIYMPSDLMATIFVFPQILGFLKGFHTSPLCRASSSSAFPRNRTETRKFRRRCVGSGAFQFVLLLCGRVPPLALKLTAFKCHFVIKQVLNSQVMTNSSFSAYNSVLSHYPSLGGSPGLQDMADMPNLKGLKVLAAARRMTDNGLENARICQFEVPGGGECRDAACGDIHLSLLQVEPHGAPRPITIVLIPTCHHLIDSTGVGGDTVFFTDEEIARYLCGDRNVAQMVQALQAARTRRPEASFYERVKEAWTSTRGQWTLDKT